MRPTRLSADSLQEALAALPGWQRAADREAIVRAFEFKDFRQAFAFMTRVALMAERLDHHPEWRNVYKHVEILLTTHDAGGVTQLDIELARYCDDVAGE